MTASARSKNACAAELGVVGYTGRDQLEQRRARRRSREADGDAAAWQAGDLRALAFAGAVGAE
jgi:hypothetical protein